MQLSLPFLDIDITARRHKGNSESQAAHERIRSCKSELHLTIMAELASVKAGLTCAELESRSQSETPDSKRPNQRIAQVRPSTAEWPTPRWFCRPSDRLNLPIPLLPP